MMHDNGGDNDMLYALHHVAVSALILLPQLDFSHVPAMGTEQDFEQAVGDEESLFIKESRYAKVSE